MIRWLDSVLSPFWQAADCFHKLWRRPRTTPRFRFFFCSAQSKNVFFNMQGNHCVIHIHSVDTSHTTLMHVSLFCLLSPCVSHWGMKCSHFTLLTGSKMLLHKLQINWTPAKFRFTPTEEKVTLQLKRRRGKNPSKKKKNITFEYFCTEKNSGHKHLSQSSACCSHCNYPHNPSLHSV